MKITTQRVSEAIFVQSEITPDHIARQMIHRLIDDMSMLELSRIFYVGRWDYRNNQMPLAYCGDIVRNREKISMLKEMGVIEFVAFAKPTNND